MVLGETGFTLECQLKESLESRSIIASENNYILIYNKLDLIL